MRLSDRQYKLYTRTGFALTILAAVAYDNVSPGFQSAVISVAVIGALIGFSPLATRHPFRSNEEEDIADRGISDSDVRDVSDHSYTTLYPLDDQETPEVSNSSSLNLVDYMHAVMDKRLVSMGGCVPDYDIVTNSMIIYFKSSDIHRERSERVNEVYELVQKLRGIPQEFSVELKSTNSIVVHCERPKESANLLGRIGNNWDYMAGIAESVQRETIH